MYGVIISAHSEYSKGLHSALKLVAGDMKNLRVVNYLENQSYEDLDKNLKSEYEDLKKSGYEKIICITDLLGGTPFSRCVLNFQDDDKVRVLSGMNFPMVFTALTMGAKGDMDKDIEEVMKAGKDGITVYEVKEDKETEDQQDGI